MDRKSLRTTLAPFEANVFWLPVTSTLLDALLWIAGQALALISDSAAPRLLGSTLIALATSRLFIIGHDACHQSLTPSRPLNRILGRLCFLPTLTPYSMWEVGHNVAHHGYTNLRGHDYVWEPVTPAQYAAMPAWRRALERFYRGGMGFWLYYLIEMWWKRLFFPSRSYVPVRRPVFLRDCLLVAGFAVLWIGVTIGYALWAQASVFAALSFGVVLPYLLWNGCIGFVTYCQHTHPDIAWYASKTEWSAAKAYISATAHPQFSLPLGGLFHWIFEHPAHHLDMSIPFYHLRAAQAVLQRECGDLLVATHLTWANYWRNALACGAYDFDRKVWVPLAK